MRGQPFGKSEGWRLQLPDGVWCLSWADPREDRPKQSPASGVQLIDWVNAPQTRVNNWPGLLKGSRAVVFDPGRGLVDGAKAQSRDWAIEWWFAQKAVERAHTHTHTHTNTPVLEECRGRGDNFNVLSTAAIASRQIFLFLLSSVLHCASCGTITDSKDILKLLRVKVCPITFTASNTHIV